MVCYSRISHSQPLTSTHIYKVILFIINIIVPPLAARVNEFQEYFCMQIISISNTILILILLLTQSSLISSHSRAPSSHSSCSPSRTSSHIQALLPLYSQETTFQITLRLGFGKPHHGQGAL